jgi:hypothetical protein
MPAYPQEEPALATSARPRIKINIATPSYVSTFAGTYVRSLYALLATAPRSGIAYSFSDIDYADIVAARNYLASNFLYHKPDCTHMLFIDDDMGFSPQLVHGMLALQQDVVGVVYPKRKLDLKRLHALGHLDFDKAYAQACDFVGGADLKKSKGDFVEVDACGTGVMLISRRCLETMVAKIPQAVDREQVQRLPFRTKFTEFLRVFDKVQLPDRELSEDFSFCWRWRHQCGGKIYANVTERVQHVGELTVDARYADR